MKVYQSVGGKLLIAFSAVLLLIALQGMNGLYNLRKIDHAYNERIAGIHAIDDARADLALARLRVFQFLGTSKPKEMEEIRGLLDASFNGWARRYKGLALDKVLLNETIGNYREILTLHENFQTKKAYKLIYGASRANHEAVMRHLDKQQKKLGDLAQRDIDSKKRSANSWTVAYLLMGILMVAGATWRLSRDIVRPIRKAVGLADTIRQGDLTCRIDEQDHGQGEIGQLTDALNEMCEGLSGIIGKIRTHSGQLTQSSENLIAIAGDLAGSSSSIADQTGSVSKDSAGISARIGEVARAAEHATGSVCSVSDAVGEMSEGMTRISGRVNEIYQNTENIATALEEMSATVNEITMNTESAANISSDARENTNRARETMGKMADSVAAVSGVIELIQAIAARTNLLALNATIEAARAGEAGRGFSVVASEVKGLSIQTSEAVQNIIELNQGIKANTDLSISAIADIADIIDHLNAVNQTIAGAVEQQSASTNELSQGTTLVAEALQAANVDVNRASERAEQIRENAVLLNTDMGNISRNVTETSDGASNVTGSTKTLESAVGRVSRGSQNIQQDAEELARVSGSLNEMVAHFSV